MDIKIGSFEMKDVNGEGLAIFIGVMTVIMIMFITSVMGIIYK